MGEGKGTIRFSEPLSNAGCVVLIYNQAPRVEAFQLALLKREFPREPQFSLEERGELCTGLRPLGLSGLRHHHVDRRNSSVGRSGRTVVGSFTTALPTAKASSRRAAPGS